MEYFFEEYGKVGAYHVKELVCHLIEHLIGNCKTLTVGLPDRGVVKLTESCVTAEPAENYHNITSGCIFCKFAV